MTFGLGSLNQVDSIKIIWPNKKTQHIGLTKVNQSLIFNIEDAKNDFKSTKTTVSKTYFYEITNILVPHKEDVYIDFNFEGLIPKMLSREGPAMAIGDVDNDGNDDVFIGGASNQLGKLYLQKKSGELSPSKFTTESFFEDTCANFIDIDNDKDLDLIVGSGGNFQEARTGVRAYINDGKGNFSDYKILVRTKTNISKIAPNDFDGDGDIDLFVASLSVVGTYGLNPDNVLLENDGKGNFRDVTNEKALKTKSIGMSSDAIWQDIDGDEIKDLIVVGEWMSPKIFKNTGSHLVEYSTNLSDYSGWYNAVKGEDLDNDGDIDLIFGNRGLNSFYEADKEHPAKMYINDFDANGTVEQIFTRSIEGRDVPIHLKRELTSQIVSLKKQNSKFSEYSTKSIDDLFPKNIIEASTVKDITTFSSFIALNNGKGDFAIKKLPAEAQFSCICDIQCDDINKDGNVDLILGGNDFSFKPQFSRLDANKGLVLFSDEKGNFKNQTGSGFKVEGEVKVMEWFKDKVGKRYLIVGINNGQAKIFKMND
jgi:hypothetical protein